MRTLTIKRDIDNGLKAKNLLARLSEILSSAKENEISISFEEVSFIAANQLAVLGALFDEFCGASGKQIYINDLSPRLKMVMQKNGFGQRIGLEPIMDRFHTTIPYREFQTNESDEFEKYLILNIFQRNDIPMMSDAAKNTIIDNILEVFNNVKEHTTSKSVYACGQFFPKSKKMYFSIVDVGETIKENVVNYFELMKKDLETSNYIEWAMKEGNSTRNNDSPGGLGFSMLSRFIELNKGELSIVSDNECYEFKVNKYRTSQMSYRFMGTIVTVAINMRDTFSYLSVNNNIEQIIF
ncbi:MAG: FAM114 family protein [Lachnospiraceae bacterium]|nr:FAM114 family protein [Lachnospiraceae bacterium]